MCFQASAQVPICEMGNCGGPINITSFADSTNLNGVVPFPGEFNRGDKIRIVGEYENEQIMPDSIVIWHQVWAADWSGTVYEETPGQFVYNSAKEIGEANGVIDMEYEIPADAPYFGKFHDANDSTATSANHYIQVRVFYPPELELDVFWYQFVRITPKDTPTVEVPICEMGNCGGPINITSFADSTNLNGVVPFPVTFNRGDEINIQGEYGLVPPGLIPDSIVVWHQVWASDWSGTVYESAPQWIIYGDEVGCLDGQINVDYTIPDDAPFYGDFHDVNDSTAAAANHYIQVRIFYPAELEIDAFWYQFVRIEEKDVDIPTVEVANCEMGNCGGPINITSFADSTNLNPVVPFPVTFNRGDVINIKGEYGVVPPNLVPDSVVVWHQVWAADWSGTVYESAPQWILNEDVGMIDGKIDVDYVIPDDAPFYGDFHDVNDTTAAAANHYIQVRVFYPAELELDVFWYHFCAH